LINNKLQTLKILKKPKKSILSSLDFSGGKNTLFMDICNS